MEYKIGIDVGGTFTDFLLTSDDGHSEVYKVLSTPEDPSIGLLNGLSEMAKAQKLSLNDFIKKVSIIVHGTTVTTNAVLTRRGSKTGLLTTKGLRDALEMRRGIREEQYNNRYTNVEPLVPRYLRYPIEERLDYKGDTIVDINELDVLDAIKLFDKDNIQSIAICFMNAFANPDHEAKAAKIIKEQLPEAYLTVSSTFLPSIRFYDRVSTTVLNSYVGPILKSYLSSLIEKLENIGFNGILLIMQSNGGVISPQFAMDNAAVTLLSGPAAGPVAGIEYTSIHDYTDCITIDMGGTSFDAALIKDKTPLVTTEGEIDRLRLALPMLGIVTIGAGGGSIGWVDEGGLLRMGPQSAGSKPGPACYDLGGELPTCTDADLILGYLDKDFFAGGKIPLNYDKATRAIEEHIAGKLNMDVVEAAAGMYQVINVNMASGVREVSVKRGDDPREFPLVVAGGAGPVHACMIALELEIPVMIIPKESSIFCAAGMLMSDLKHNFVRTYSTRLDRIDQHKFMSLFREMESEAAKLLGEEHIPESSIEFVYSLDMRYLKQYHELNVVITREEMENGDINSIAAKFHPEHSRLYGYSLEKEETPIELINLRLLSIGKTVKPQFRLEEYAGEDPSGAFKKERKVWLPLERAFEEVPVYDGAKLRYGNKVEGPALIEQVNTTTFITPEYSVLCDRYGSYSMYLKTKEAEIRNKIIAASS
ncbi:MAG: hydantoinase/oxoprolinase family protein [Candidatus Latescibacteria bacterium]|nr:hydantoinase/oxoprolinase family protein [Candidatus Latescibacterota bacterium]NIM64467.1 hydantoinase/oxoprolinase family protein [Candidatus Latescibacterota bacterium]NIO00620.1 hydantoinase/oxoprolinase family protein [Candidatus Latescibacterota bacterium]NIO27021.1 hydantoinase/oxoprolinase family protein [Candidatus Latescibacterota bacterium]NIO56098.1 hydantoinase/oxoprolinase family protein [Candidatus Latescibacterota bacterium]